MRIEPDQRRRLQFVAAALFAVTLLVAGLVVAFRGDDNNTVDASSNSTTSTSADLIVVPTSAGDPTTTAKKSVATSAPTTTSTTVRPPDDPNDLRCAHTTKANAAPNDDWQMYWTTDPGPNEPLDLLICVDDLTPAVGQVVNLSVVANDKDASIGTGDCDVNVSWNNDGGSLCRDTVVASQPFPPPAKQKGHIQLAFTHKYEHAGESTIDVSVWSGPADGKHYPYNSYASVELTINVHAK